MKKLLSLFLCIAVVVTMTPAIAFATPNGTVDDSDICKIGDTGYATLAEAINAVPAENETEIVMLADIGSENIYAEYGSVYANTIPANKKVILDLNGKRIYAKTTVNGETCFFRVENGGKLTIKDSVGGGAINYLDGNDNTGGFVVCSAGEFVLKSGTLENKTECVNSAIQGAVDVHANEWGQSYYTANTEFTMTGGSLKSQNDNTLRLYDSSQTGSGKVNIKAAISGGEITGADAVFIMPQGTNQYDVNQEKTHYMNPISVNVTGGNFTTKNGIRVCGGVGVKNTDSAMIHIQYTDDAEFVTSDTEKYRVYGVAFQETSTWTSTKDSTANLRSFVEVNGKIASNFYQDNEDVYHIMNLEGLKEFRDQANAGNLNGQNSDGGHTQVVLDADVDLNNEEWTPISVSCVDFDGQNHTIKNLRAKEVKVGEEGKQQWCSGLFASASISGVKNLTVDTASVSSHHYAAAIAAHGLCAKIENCTVKNANVKSLVEVLQTGYDNGDKAGAICGYLSGEPNAWVKNCNIEDCTISGYRDIGGVVGYANGTAEVSDNSIKNTTIINNQEHNYKNYTSNKEFDVNEVVGEASSKATVNNNNATNVTKKMNPCLAKIGKENYSSLRIAINDAESGDTIELLGDVELDYSNSEYSLDIDKNGITIDGNNHKITPKTSEEWDRYKVGGASCRYGSYNFIKITADDVKLKDATVDIGEYRGLSCATTKGGSNVIYDNVTMKGRGSGHYYGYASNGTVTFKDCEIKTTGYGIHMASEASTEDEVVVDNCKVYGWNSFGTCKNVTAKDSYFGSSDDEGKNGILALFKPYCQATLTNCTFSEEYAMGDNDAYKYVGLGAGAAVTVTLKGCKVEGDKDIQDIIHYANDVFETDDAAENAIFVFDSVKAADGKYIAGTFQTKKNASSVECADDSKAVEVRTSSGDVKRSGKGAIYLVGKNAEGTDLKITAGEFASDPAAYVMEEYIVTDSGNNETPFLVREKKEKDPEQPTVIHEETKASISEDVKFNTTEEKEVAEQAASKTTVDGVKTAIDENELLKAAKGAEGTTITDNTVDEATMIEYSITAVATVTESKEATADTGTLTFEVKPVATVSTHKDGVVTGIAENVPIDNTYLNGDEITVVVGCAGINPTQVVHKSSDGTVEVFTQGGQASHKDLKFSYDASTKTVTIKINKFSTVEVYGTNTYATVTYFSNNGTGETYAVGTIPGAYTLLKNEFTAPEGKEFAGWKKDGSSKVFEPGERTVVNEDTTFTAQWKDKSDPTPSPSPSPSPTTNEYTVTFNVQGHGTAPATQTVAEGGKVVEPKDPVAEGYIFGGWFEEKSCTNAWRFDYDTVAKNITLYAKWTEKSSGKTELKDCEITVEPDAFAFNNKVQVPTITVLQPSGIKMVNGTDYTVEKPKSVNVGAYTLVFTGMGNYTGTVKLSYKINPAAKSISTVKAGKKKITVKWKKSSKTYLAQTTGYQIRYSTSSSFNTYSTEKASKKSTSKTITSLKSHKRYYVKMRAYYKDDNGKNYYSKWSKAKTLRTR